MLCTAQEAQPGSRLSWWALARGGSSPFGKGQPCSSWKVPELESAGKTSTLQELVFWRGVPSPHSTEGFVPCSRTAALAGGSVPPGLGAALPCCQLQCSSREGPAQSGFSYLVKVESFSRKTLKQGLCSESLCQHDNMSLYAVGGHYRGQGMR